MIKSRSWASEIRLYTSEVKYDEMWQIHYIADYFVNLRTDEIFGMAIMEAVYYQRKL